MATVELVGAPADGAGPGGQFYSAELKNALAASNGAGVKASTLSATVTGGDMNITFPAITAACPDGSGGLTQVSYAGGTVTVAASDPTNPRTSHFELRANGTVAEVAGAATAETGTVVEAPMGSLTSTGIMLCKVRVAAAVTTISSAVVFGRAINVNSQGGAVIVRKYMTSTVVYTTNVVNADVPTSGGGTMSFPVVASGVYLAEFFLPVSFGGTGGLSAQFTGPAAATSVDVTIEYVANITVATPSIGTAVKGYPAATAFSSELLGLNSEATQTTAGKFNTGTPGQGSFVRLHLRLINGANAGTVTLQASQASSNSTTTLGVGSYMRAERIA